MPRTLKDIFEDYQGLETIEVVGVNNGGRFGISEDGKALKILDDAFAKELSWLPGADTEAGHTTVEGYRVRGGFEIYLGSYKATVRRSVKE